MKDRTSKHPGRVKLKPVAGQTDTYDMTRADDPDDTGTPFNTRTMLQDSTGRFLRLPYANPLVDDAFRHMVDRIVPIGTIRTSPAQSLGDAWLKCDGSTVTFENYPQLCSVLRNTGGAVTWDTNAFPASYNAKSVSNTVYFDGMWFVCAQVGSNFKILKSSAVGGTFSEEATFTGSETTYEGIMCSLAVSDDYCVCAYRVGINVKIAVREKGNTSWTQVGVTLPSDSKDGTGFFGIAECNGKFGFAIERYGGSTDEYSDKTYVVLSDAPLDSGSWQYSMITKTNDISGNKFFGYKFSSANGKWFLSAIRQETGSSFSGDVELHVANGSETSFTKIKTPVKSVVMKRYSASEVVFLSGKYYFLGTYYSQYNSSSGIFYRPVSTVYSSENLTNWGSSIVTGENKQATTCVSYASASESTLLVATQTEVWTTSSQNDGFNQATVPTTAITAVALQGMTATASYKGGVAYHDYTYDSRLLPTISLSDDTTTFIKAKNELDVFESQQSGGD